MRRWTVRILSAGLVIFALLFIIGVYMAPAGSDEVLKDLLDKDIEPQPFAVSTADSRVIGGYTFGDSNNPALLLIHGSPGDWSAWKNIIISEPILDNYYIIALDRPGYGLTTVPSKADLKTQAAIIWQVIYDLDLDNITVVGHSYGGAVALQLLVDNDEKFNTGVLVAGTVSPVHMQPRWYNKVASWSLSKIILPINLLASNHEMMGLPHSLELIAQELSGIKTPIVLMQGTKDILVPNESVDYFKQVKPAGVDYIILEDNNHFIPWTEPELINDVLLNLIK